MKSNGKKFLSALLVSSMVLTSSLGFMPRTAQAVDSSAVHSFDFEYINEDQAASNRQIVITTEKKLDVVDRRGFSIEGNKAEIGSVQWSPNGTTIKVEIEGIDPEIVDYKLVIAPGSIEFDGTGYQQLAPIEINFKNYEITPGFASIFKNVEEANTVFKNNKDKTEIKIIIDSKHIKTVTGKTVSGEVNWTELAVETTDQVDSVKFTIQGDDSAENIRKVENDGSGSFKATYAGESGVKNFRVQAYDADGRELDNQVVKYDFGGTTAPNFTAEDGTVFDVTEYSVQDIIDGTVDLNVILQGKSYADLMNVNVSYPNHKGFITVNDLGELAEALGKLGTNGELNGESVKIKLMTDISLSQNLILAHNTSLMIDGNGHTISGGDITLGDATDKVVKLSNVTVDGNVVINVGDDGDAYLTDVVVTAGNEILVESVGYSSATLTRTTADQLTMSNEDPAHVIAGQGTVIQNTDLAAAASKSNVKLTSIMGGIFNVINLATDKQLEIIDESDSQYPGVFKEVKIASGILNDSSNPVDAKLVIGKNTTLDKLTANNGVDLVGMTNAKITEAVASSNLATGAVNTNGVSVGTYDPAEKFSNVGEVADNVLEIPNTADNLVVMGGNAYDGITATQVNKNEVTLELTLQSMAGDQPLNIKWNGSISATEVASLLVDGGSGDGMNTAAKFTHSVSTDGKTLSIKWDAVTITATEQFDVTVDPTKFVSGMFESLITDLTNTDYQTDFASKYAPKFREKADGTFFNKFVVFMDNQADLGKVTLTTADTTDSEKLKWWEATGNDLTLDIIDLNAGKDNVVNYYLDNTAPTAYSGTTGNATITALDLQNALSGNSKVNIYAESTGANANDEKILFTLEQGHVYFDKDVLDSTLNAALADEDIEVIHLEAGGDYGDGTELTVGDRSTGVQLVAYKVGDKSTVTGLEFARTPNDLDKMSFVNVTAVDGGVPTITSVVGTTIDGAGDTIEITFSESMDDAKVVVPGSWVFKLDANGTDAADGAVVDLTGATFGYDDVDKKLTVTLFDDEDSSLINTNFIEVDPSDTADTLEDVAGNDLAGAVTYGTSQVAITGDTTGMSIASATTVQTSSQGTLTVDTLPTANDTMTIGTTVYTFVASGDFDTAGEIPIAAGDLAATKASIVAAINGTDGTNTVANAFVTAGAFALNDSILTATAAYDGAFGDTVATTETFTTGTNTFDGGTLGTTNAGQDVVTVNLSEGYKAADVDNADSNSDFAVDNGGAATITATTVETNTTTLTVTITASDKQIKGANVNIKATAIKDYAENDNSTTAIAVN